MPVATFAIEGLTLTPQWRAALLHDGIEQPTPVQTAAVGPILAGHDVSIQSGTGTGKTLAYLLPLLQRLQADSRWRVVVVAPSPELAMQILRVATAYSPPGVACVGLVGGGNIARQKDKLKKHPRILVGTPGRVLELMALKKIKLPTVSALVLDEADEILSPINQQAFAAVCGHATFAAQLICASASYEAPTHAFVTSFMRPDRFMIRLDNQPLQENIRHLAVPFDPLRKEVALIRLVEQFHIKQALVFVNRIAHVAHLYRFLNDRGITAGGLSSAGSKGVRQQAIATLKAGKTRLLITTDAVARGLDIKGLGWVIHYEMARTAQTYLHRAGRTGRAGGTGHSVVMACAAEAHLMRRYASELGLQFLWPRR